MTQLPAPHSELNAIYTYCQNDTISFGVNPNYQAEWSGLFSSTLDTISFLAQQNGEILLELEQNGCLSSEAISIIVNPVPYPTISGDAVACQNSYWQEYQFTQTSNQLNWDISNGSVMANTNNSIFIHWGLGPEGVINITETNNQTGCSSVVSYLVTLSEELAIDTIEILQLSPSVLYLTQSFQNMSWGYQSFLTNIPVYAGVYSQYCQFANFNPSLNAYWVEVGDGNGCLTKSYFNSPNYASNFEFEEPSMELFPNPTSNLINLKTNLPFFTYKVQTLNGLIVNYGKAEFATSIDLADLADGVYYIHLSYKDRTFVNKIIKINA